MRTNKSKDPGGLVPRSIKFPKGLNDRILAYSERNYNSFMGAVLSLCERGLQYDELISKVPLKGGALHYDVSESEVQGIQKESLPTSGPQRGPKKDVTEEAGAE